MNSKKRRDRLQKKIKPVWALTEGEVETKVDEEAEDLLNFVSFCFKYLLMISSVHSDLYHDDFIATFILLI